MMIEQGIIREVRALESARVFAGTNQKGLRTIEELKTQMRSKSDGLMSDLQSYYRQLHGSNPPPQTLTAEEQSAHRKIPANTPVLDDYFTNRSKVASSRRGMLHGLMRDEVYNFVDGKRSYYDIYRAVYAESQAAGSWSYGTVSLKDVVSLLDAAVEAKALTLKQSP